MTKKQMAVLEWLNGSDRGLSSEALAHCYLGNKRPNVTFGWCAPGDPADLGRCLRLVRLVPDVRECVDELAALSTAWARVAPVWDELAALMEGEVGIDWSKARRAPRTYAAMKGAGL
jgi:hypothetical protein